MHNLKEEELADLARMLRDCQSKLLHHFVGGRAQFEACCISQSEAAPHGSQTHAQEKSCNADASAELIAAYRPAAASVGSAGAVCPASASAASLATDDGRTHSAASHSYWEHHTRELTGPQAGDTRDWALVERELGKHLLVLQSRMSLAQRVSAKAAENAALQSSVRMTLGSNGSGMGMQLPPVLLASAALQAVAEKRMP